MARHRWLLANHTHEPVSRYWDHDASSAQGHRIRQLLEKKTAGGNHCTDCVSYPTMACLQIMHWTQSTVSPSPCSYNRCLKNTLPPISTEKNILLEISIRVIGQHPRAVRKILHCSIITYLKLDTSLRAMGFIAPYKQ
jgi:hypothetical protein